MTYDEQIHELVYLKNVIIDIITKKDIRSDDILEHTQKHVCSVDTLPTKVKQELTRKKKQSLVINSSGSPESLFIQALHAINENILECQFYKTCEPDEYQLLVKRLSFPKGHDKQWYVSMTNANAFIANKGPANCYVLSLDSCGKYCIYVGYDSMLCKRGYKNDPKLLWTPKILSREGNIIKFELPLGPVLGWPLYTHTSVNPFCGLHQYKNLHEIEKKKNQSDLL